MTDSDQLGGEPVENVLEQRRDDAPGEYDGLEPAELPTEAATPTSRSQRPGGRPLVSRV